MTTLFIGIVLGAAVMYYAVRMGYVKIHRK